MKIGCWEVPKPSYPPLLWLAEWKAPAPLYLLLYYSKINLSHVNVQRTAGNYNANDPICIPTPRLQGNQMLLRKLVELSKASKCKYLKFMFCTKNVISLCTSFFLQFCILCNVVLYSWSFRALIQGLPKKSLSRVAHPLHQYWVPVKVITIYTVAIINNSTKTRLDNSININVVKYLTIFNIVIIANYIKCIYKLGVFCFQRIQKIELKPRTFHDHVFPQTKQEVIGNIFTPKAW